MVKLCGLERKVVICGRKKYIDCQIMRNWAAEAWHYFNKFRSKLKPT